MASNKPTPASVFVTASPVTRDDLTRAGARPGPHAGNGGPPAAGEDTMTGRALGLAARALLVAIGKVADKREALAATVAGARASQLSDEVIRAHLVVAGLDPADVDEAMG